MRTGTGLTSGAAVEEIGNGGESRYRQMFEKNRAVQLLIDPATGNIVDANPAAAEFYGYDLETLKHLRISAINRLPPGQVTKAMAKAASERQSTFLFRHRLASGEIRDVEVRSSPVMIGGRQLLYSIIHDVTEQRRAEAALRQQVEFEKLVADIARLFLHLPPDAIDDGIQRALQTIGEFAAVDRSYLYLVSSDLATTERGYEWCAPGVDTGLHATLALAMGSFAWAIQQLQRQEVLHVPRVADLPPEASAEKEALEAQNVRSVLIVPLVSPPFIGMLGFDVVRAEKIWAEESIALLKIVRDVIAHALQRKRVEEERQEEAQVTAALARVGQELIASLDEARLLDRVCQLTAEVLQCESSHTFLRRAEGGALAPVANFGAAPEQWEALRVLEIPSQEIQPLLDLLAREDIVQLSAADPQSFIPPELFRRFGTQMGLCIALRRGATLLGVQTAGYRTRTQPVSPRTLRIARGIAQLTSLALGNARLLEEAEQANRLKSDFLATMSHELRTPLNIIIGYTDLLVEGEFGALSAEQTRLLRKVEGSSRELLELINATLDVSRFEAGQLPVELRPMDLGDFVAELQRETAHWTIRPGVTLEWAAPHAALTLHTDRAKLKVIVKNLLGNALKFTERGVVRVEARAVEGGAKISVSDTGIGIPAEVLPVIFDMFRQGDAAAARRYGGVGLGLYIVRRLLDLLGGAISVESEVGQGSTFHLWIPQRQ